MTEQAAERALNAIELAKPVQESCSRRASARRALGEVVRRAARAGGRRALMRYARLPAARARRDQATNAQLLEIMLAQDFQDLTGQVIKKITDVVYLIEQQLLGVLLENIAPERREQFAAIGGGAGRRRLDRQSRSLLNGPQINPEGRSDVVQDQSQVDDLLASLGF